MKTKLIAFFLFTSIIGTILFTQSATLISKNKASLGDTYVYCSSQIQTCIPTPIVEIPTGEGS